MTVNIKNSYMIKVLNYAGIIWLIPLFSIAYIDGTVLMLIVMFLIPVVLVILLLIALKGGAFSIPKTFKLPSVVLAILSTIFILILGYQHNSPRNLFENHIAKPIPESVRIIETDGSAPSFGISSLSFLFEMAPSDLDNLIASKALIKNSIEKPNGKSPHLYKEALKEAKELIGDVSSIYIVDDENSKYRCKVLITNQRRDTIYYRIY